MAGELIYVLAACGGGQNQPQETASNQAPKNECIDQNGLSATFTDSFSLTGTESIQGTIQTLFSVSGQGFWAVNYQPGTWDDGEKIPSSFQLGQVDENGFESSIELPNAENRSYGRAIANSDGSLIAIPYSSTEGIEGQDGTEHGVLVYDLNSQNYIDHDLASLGLTGVSSVMFGSYGQLLVLTTNQNIQAQGGDLFKKVTFDGASSLAIFQNPSKTTEPQIIDLPDAVNAQSMGFVNESTLAVFATESLGDLENETTVSYVDLDSRNVKFGDYIGQSGLATNGPLPMLGNGAFVVTGLSADGEALGTYGFQSGLTVYSLPLELMSDITDDENSIYSWPYIPEAFRVSGTGTVLFTSRQTDKNRSPFAGVYALNTDNNKSTQVGQVIADSFPVSAYDPETNLACVAGNQSNGTADLMCWSVEKVCE